MIHFVGAGSGAVDLITVRGQKLLKEADIVVYAGSLVNPELLKNCQKDCQIYNSAKMTLEEVMEVMISGEKQEKKLSGCIRVIRVCMVRSKSRWICWKRRIFLIKCARESAPFAERHLH